MYVVELWFTALSNASAILHPYRTYRRYRRYRTFYQIPILYMAYTTIPPIPYTPTPTPTPASCYRHWLLIVYIFMYGISNHVNQAKDKYSPWLPRFMKQFRANWHRRGGKPAVVSQRLYLAVERAQCVIHHVNVELWTSCSRNSFLPTTTLSTPLVGLFSLTVFPACPYLFACSATVAVHLILNVDKLF